MAKMAKKPKAVKAAAKTVAKAEVYRARRGKEVAPAAMARAAAAPSGYTIEVVFLGGLTPKQKAAFKLAAKRWTSVIVGDSRNCFASSASEGTDENAIFSPKFQPLRTAVSD